MKFEAEIQQIIIRSVTSRNEQMIFDRKIFTKLPENFSKNFRNLDKVAILRLSC